MDIVMGHAPTASSPIPAKAKSATWNFVRGNLAIRDHIKNGRDLLLFEKLPEPGSYHFVGHFACDGFEYATAPDRTGASRRNIVFHLQ
jgi:5-methylcytosine-specific restriction protein A